MDSLYCVATAASLDFHFQLNPHMKSRPIDSLYYVATGPSLDFHSSLPAEMYIRPITNARDGVYLVLTILASSGFHYSLQHDMFSRPMDSQHYATTSTSRNFHS
jgi:hypothetical protein